MIGTLVGVISAETVRRFSRSGKANSIAGMHPYFNAARLATAKGLSPVDDWNAALRAGAFPSDPARAPGRRPALRWHLKIRRSAGSRDSLPSTTDEYPFAGTVLKLMRYPGHARSRRPRPMPALPNPVAYPIPRATHPNEARSRRNRHLLRHRQRRRRRHNNFLSDASTGAVVRRRLGDAAGGQDHSGQCQGDPGK